MQDEGTDTPREGDTDHSRDVGAEDDHSDWMVLSTLLAPEGHDGLWSVDELGRAMENPVRAADSIGRLRRAGLIHQHGEFVFATRAATRFNEIVE